MATRVKNTLAFDPRSISGLQLWLDGTDSSTVILSGANVSQWKDKSGINNHYNNSGLGTISYTNNSLYFPGTGYMQNTSPTNFSAGNTPSMTLFVVFSYINATNTRGIFQYGQVSCAQTGYVNYVDTDNKIYGTLYCGALSVNSSVNTNTTYLLSDVLTYSGTPGNVSRAAFLTGNPMSVPTATTTGVNLNLNSISRLGDAAGQYFYGYISEVLYYNVSLTTSQRQQVEGYLAWKWGLNASLPTSHSLKNQIAPFPYTITAVKTKNTAFPYLDPRSIPGCALWLDAVDSATLFTDTSATTVANAGNLIARWNDKSASGNHLLQSTLGNRPTLSNFTPLSNQVRGVYFATNGLSLNSINNNASTGNSSRTIFVVQYAQSATSVTRIGTGTHAVNTPPTAFGFDNSTPTGVATLWSPYVYSAADVTRTIQLRTFSLLYAYYDSSISTLGGGYDFGNVLTKSTTLNTAATPWYFGLRPDNNGSVDSYICEFLHFNRVLSSTELQQIEGYLAWKWGIKRNLPSNHLHVSYPPNTFQLSAPRKAVAQRAPRTFTQTFTYTGSLQTFNVPSNVTSMTVYLWGAGGGGGYVSGGFTPGNGGAGAMVQGILSVTGGSTVYIVVGKAGAFAEVNNQADATGGGGMAYYDGTLSGYTGLGSSGWGAGSGGGRSAIQFSSGGADQVVAGGGGGGGVVGSGQASGGAATFSGTANGGTSAGGGTQTAGGSAGNSNGLAGSQKLGGGGWTRVSNFGGGGGGGGYYGGGGGGNPNAYSSGGGGSSFTGNLSAISGQPLGYNSSNGQAAPNTSSSYYQSGVAVGGSASSSAGTPGTSFAGGNGLVVLVYSS